jgi:hypothetical protein
MDSVADPGGSGFFPSQTPDPDFFHPGSRICIKEFKYFSLKKWFQSSRKSRSRSGLFISDLDPDFLPIQDPRVKKVPDPGSGSATLQNSIWKPQVSSLRRLCPETSTKLYVVMNSTARQRKHGPQRRRRWGGGGPTARVVLPS